MLKVRLGSAIPPVAAALTACLWAVAVPAQETLPVAGAEPGLAWHEAPDRAETSANAGAQTNEDANRFAENGNRGQLQLRERALAAMEALREEIVTFTALRDAQAALLSWNREGAKTGAPAQALPAGLCVDPALAAWCPLLPATFGAPSTEDGHDRN